MARQIDAECLPVDKSSEHPHSSDEEILVKQEERETNLLENSEGHKSDDITVHVYSQIARETTSTFQQCPVEKENMTVFTVAEMVQDNENENFCSTNSEMRPDASKENSSFAEVTGYSLLSDSPSTAEMIQNTPGKHPINGTCSPKWCRKDRPQGSYICDMCGECFPSTMHLTSHIRTHTHEKPYSCDDCGQNFSWLTSLLQHKQKHTSDKPVQASQKPYQCFICSKGFSRLYCLSEHTKIHTGERQHRCDQCGESFIQSATLTRHKLVHTSEKPHKCKDCGKSFTRRHNLYEHATMHSGDKPFTCDICGKMYSKSAHLSRHKRIHTGEKPYKCEYCGKCFTMSHCLSEHERTHTGEKPFKCDLCGKCFSQSSKLSSHRRIHTGEKPFHCDICEKSFTRSDHLSKHKMVHTKETPFECKECGKCFSQTSNLYTHFKRTHSGQRPYKCDRCDKYFATPSEVRKHQRVHSKQNGPSAGKRAFGESSEDKITNEACFIPEIQKPIPNPAMNSQVFPEQEMRTDETVPPKLDRHNGISSGSNVTKVAGDVSYVETKMLYKGTSIPNVAVTENSSIVKVVAMEDSLNSDFVQMVENSTDHEYADCIEQENTACIKGHLTDM